MKKLTESERERFLRDNPAWRATAGRDAVTRDFEFEDFAAAWAFMTRVAAQAERIDHHPDWSNSYGRVTITLTSHDSGGLTDRDATLAARVDRAVDPA